MSPAAGTTNAVVGDLKVVIEGVSNQFLVVFKFRPQPPVVRSNFTIAVLPDTQRYSGSVKGASPEMFYAQTEWIATNRAKYNIVYAVQLGDIVQNVNLFESEWQVAANAMYRLEDPIKTGLESGLPYGIAPGDHDGPPYSFFNLYFSADRFRGRSYFGGHYSTNNNNSFVLFSAAGLDFVALHLEYNPGSNILAWAEKALATHSDREGIVASHSVLFPSATGAIFTAQGRPVFDALKKCTNLSFILCGHHPTTGMRRDTNFNHVITSLLSDYSYMEIGTNAWMRIMEFVPSNNVVNVRTYSPLLDRFYLGLHHQFSFHYDMSLERKGFKTAASIVTNGNPVSLSAKVPQALLPGTAYEWKVEVSNGVETYSSPVWRFVTAPGTNSPPPLRIIAYHADSVGRSFFSWSTVGGRRYRVEYSDAGPGATFTGNFVEIVRAEAEERESASQNSASTKVFIDDFLLTGGPPQHGARFFRVKEIP